MKVQLCFWWLQRNMILEDWKKKGSACCRARGSRARRVRWVLHNGCGGKRQSYWQVKDTFRDTLHSWWCCLLHMQLNLKPSGSETPCPPSFHLQDQLNLYYPFLMLFQCVCRGVGHYVYSMGDFMEGYQTHVNNLYVSSASFRALEHKPHQKWHNHLI